MICVFNSRSVFQLATSTTAVVLIAAGVLCAQPVGPDVGYGRGANADGVFGRGAEVRGEVSTDRGERLGDDLFVELASMSQGAVIVRSPIDSLGEFRFDSVPPGDYQLRVTNPHKVVLHQQFVTVHDHVNVLEVRLRQPQEEQPVSGTVSLSELQRKVDPKAQKEFRKAQESSEKGDFNKSIEHLEKAVEIDPAYAEAYNNLGAAYMHLGDFDRALDEFSKAQRLEPESAVVNSNLGVALLTKNRLPEAEEAARRALKSDPNSKKASFVLGMSLKEQGRGDEETIEQLQRAAPEFPKARIVAAELLAQKGETKQAAEELRRYLKSGQTEYRDSVETWLAKLDPDAAEQAAGDGQ